MSGAEIDKDLAKSLQQAKKKPRNFAIIAKGVNVLKLLVDKKPLRDGALMKAKKEYQGNAIIKGVVCGGDGAELVFQVAEEPSVGAIKLRKFIADETKLTLKARYEVVEGLAEIDDDASDEAPNEAEEVEQEAEEEAVAPAETTAAETVPPPVAPEVQPPAGEIPPPPAPPPADLDKAQFMGRLKVLKPDLDKVKAANTSVGQQLQASAAAMAGLAKNGQFAQATQALDEVEVLVKMGLGELAATAVSPGDPTAEFTARLKELLPEIKKAAGTPVGERAKLRTGEAGALAKQKDFAQANRVLDEVQALLREPLRTDAATRAAPGAERATAFPRAISNVAFQQGLLAWDAARKKAHAELQALEQEILELFSDDPRLVAVKQKIRQLDAVLGDYAEELRDRLDDAYNAPVERKPELRSQALVVLRRYRAYLSTDPFVKAVAGNKLRPIDVEGILGKTLDEVAEKLGA